MSSKHACSLLQWETLSIVQGHLLYKSLKKIVWNKGQSVLLLARFAGTQETRGEVFLHNNHPSFLHHLGFWVFHKYATMSPTPIYLTHRGRDQTPSIFLIGHLLRLLPTGLQAAGQGQPAVLTSTVPSRVLDPLR